MSPAKLQGQEEQKLIEVTAAKSLSDKPVVDDQPVVQEMHVYKKPNVLDISNPDPNRVYRYLSKKRIDHDGGNRRQWIPVIAGKDKECIGTLDVNIQEMLEEANPKTSLKDIPQQNRGTGTDLIIGDMQLHWQHKDWAKSRQETYDREARQAVEEVTVRDEKERAEIVYDALRKNGVNRSEARRFLQVTGGAMVMNTGPRRY